VTANVKSMLYVFSWVKQSKTAEVHAIFTVW